MSEPQLKPTTHADGASVIAIATRAIHPPTTHAHATSCWVSTYRKVTS